MSNQTQVYVVEFTGGPFDGYQHTPAFPPCELAALVTLPVNENTMNMSAGRPLGCRAPAKSVAIYELEETDNVFHYRYFGSMPPTRLEFDNWRG